VSHVVEEPYAIDGNEPEFISTNGPWQKNEWFQAKRGLGLVGAIDVRSAKSNGWRFARRATPSEIAAQAPSVGRDELVGVLSQVLEDALELWDMGSEANSELTSLDEYRSLVEAKDKIVERARAALAAAGKEST
jgi:hypothetical protein